MLWKITQNVLTTIVVLYTGIHWGIACIPGALLVLYTFDITSNFIFLYRAIYLGISLGLAYVLWMITTIFFTSIIGFIFRPSIGDERSAFLSMTTVRWAWHNVLDRLAKPCVHHMIPSWITDFYYRAMGCKIGKNCYISSDRINDPYLVTIGNNSVIGSKVIITPHIAEKNEIVFSPIKIGDNCLIGLGAQINPGCNIGDGAIIASRAIVPKYTNIPPGEVWAGVPARKIKDK